MKKLQQNFTVTFRYDVHFTRAIFDEENSLFQEVIEDQSSQLPAKMLIIVDDGVANHHPDLERSLYQYAEARPGTMQLCGSPVVVPGGERAKNDPQLVEQILVDINRQGIDRHAFVVAVGGGAVLDMAGYAAAIAHRGIRHIRIPTTVLSQNDSGVGVKNGINYFGKKNFLGCFTPPVAVINDLDFLRTLDNRDWRAGISEAIKVSLIKDRSFFEFLESSAPRLARREEPPMEHLIYECARLHMEHIAGGDPFEMGSSRPLDFGHWAAHKLEQLSDYRLRHGEAVAIGIALDVTYSFLKNHIDKAAWQRIIRLMHELGFEVFTPELNMKQAGRLVVLEGLDEFREHLGGQLTIMLLEQVGRGFEVHEMDEGLIREAIQLLERIHQTATIS